MKQVERRSWFSWRMAGLNLMVFIFMAEMVTSQSNYNRNSTLIRYYCSLSQVMNKEYFLSNLNTTLSKLRHQLSVNGVRYAVARTLPNGESVWGLASCREYVSKTNCVACFDFAVAQLKNCGLGNGAQGFYNDCDLRYENTFYNYETNLRGGVIICGNITSPQPRDFEITAQELLSNLRTATPRTSNFYAASSRQIANGNGTIYAFMQCYLNLSRSVCEDCLKARYGSLMACLPSTRGWAIDDGCLTRYSTIPFFEQNQTTNIIPLLWDDKTSFFKDITNFLKGHVAASIGGGVGLFFFLLLVLWLFNHQRKKKPKKTKEEEINGTVNYDYKHLQLATNNFCEENIIGKGGFGEVFKAILDDKKVVAVKKLKVRNARAKDEFENEILLTGHIYHRNVLCLLGCSTDVSNLLLVLEYMPNGSLDKYLWGTKKGSLNWKQRYDIIFGIARGLAHLHKEFHAKIIHRDIKSSNILLDDDFQPKITDFGLARFQPEDQTHVITKFGGTLGYTAPEYALHGHLSDKVDTFSFGIVILEIISGRKCTDVRFVGPSTNYLLEHAWKLYENKEHIKLIDETINANEYEEEHVMKIIEIALLCTQSPVSRRPAMSEVISILPNGQTLGKREITRSTVIDLNRRIHIGSSHNPMGDANDSRKPTELELNVQLHSEAVDDEGEWKKE